MNSPGELSVAEAKMQARLRLKAMENGATLIDPASTFLSFDTVLGRDVIIEPNVVFGPDSELYSTTFYGGGPCQGNNQGCGTVFKLQPPPNTCHSVTCPWNETLLHSFDGDDGSGPVGALVFDQSGNLDGVTTAGSLQNGGTVYQLNPSSGWMETAPLTVVNHKRPSFPRQAEGW